MSSSAPDSDESPTLPLIGEHYQLVAKLGEGAFGEVYKAEHDLLGQEFAVKLLKPELSEDRDVQDRFLDEARALIRFSHPNVVQMRHVGRHEGRLFLVMDYIEGVELDVLMRKHGAFDEKRALNLITQILAGLEAAHAAGIVHRDLKPSNIIIESHADGSERAKILDFGLSKFSAIDGPGGAHRSITGTIVGTLAYMSPEQIKGDKDIDGRSDLFAAGLILQEMLQGHHPYPGESGIVVAAKLLRDPIPPIDDEKREKLSDTTLSALARALERDRDARFASVAAFSQSLAGRGPPSDTSKVTTIQEAQAELARQEAAAKAQAEAEGKGKGAPTAKGSAKHSTVKTQRAEAVAGKKSPLVPILVVGGLLAAAGIGFAMMGGGDDPQDGPKVTDAGDPTKGDPAKATPTKSDPAKSDPAKSDPAKSDPAKATPTKSDPAKADPAKSDPAKSDPAKSDPAKSDPAKSDPAKSDPAKSDPAKSDPAKSAPAKATPTKSDPSKSDPSKSDPSKAGDTPDPEKCCDSGEDLMAQGSWQPARDLFKQAATNSQLSDEVQVRALRGAAEAWIAEADHLARTGRIDDALKAYADAGRWLDQRHSAYEKVERAVDVARLQLGFSRLHQAETETERARWFRIQGKQREAAAELKKAATNFDFALQQLDRDGVRFWEFLIRRAEMHRLSGSSKQMIADVAHTTKTNNTEVPPHMWIAHTQAARHVAEAYAAAGDAGNALAWAKKASKVAEDGAGWQEENLTRVQWLEFVRALFVQASLLKGEDPTPLHGKARFWISMAKQVDAPAWEHEDVVKARLMTADAMERYLFGLMQRHRGKGADAAKAFGEAHALVARAIGLREAAAKAGAVKPEALDYEVLAAIEAARGKAAEAAAARTKAKAADLGNPD